MSSPPDSPASPSHGRRSLLIAGGAIVLALGLWAVIAGLPRWLAAPANGGGTAATPPPAATTEARKIQATLYYVSPDGTALVAATREVPYGSTPSEQARHIVEAQVAPPPDGQQSAIPAGTTVRAVFLTNTHEAYVDLGGSIISGQSGGSLDEALAVYALVNAVAVNLPQVTAVQILVNGEEVDTLAGHLDLRAPLGKALDWVQKGH